MESLSFSLSRSRDSNGCGTSGSPSPRSSAILPRLVGRMRGKPSTGIHRRATETSAFAQSHRGRLPIAILQPRFRGKCEFSWDFAEITFPLVIGRRVTCSNVPLARPVPPTPELPTRIPFFSFISTFFSRLLYSVLEEKQKGNIGRERYDVPVIREEEMGISLYAS